MYFKLGKIANTGAFSVKKTVANRYVLREWVLIWVLSIEIVREGVCVAALSDHTDCI
jgi:hypothetical protein